MGPRPVPTFVALSAIVLSAVVAGAVALPAEQPAERTATVDPDVPDPGTFEAPTDEGVATVDGDAFDSVQAAVEAADPGETVHLAGRFDERVTVETPNVTLAAPRQGAAVLDGGGAGDVLTIAAPNVTVERVWIRNSGFEADTEDAGVVVDGRGATLRSLRLTEITFGVWVDGVDGVTVENATIVGREGVDSRAERGNGIQLWETEDVLVRGNDVTRVRDGIYFSWASDVRAVDNRLWNLRYGVHYMYSDDNLLADNLAFDNDVGYAMMVSENLRVLNNTAANNRGRSGHGMLLKEIEDSTLRGNRLLGNENGLYLYNAQDTRYVENLLLDNDVGIHDTAGSSNATVVGNSFIDNEVHAFTTRKDVVAWNGTDRGNYWSGARTVDRSNDGVGETRHRPAGTVEQLRHDHPEAAVFADSPAFSVVRLAEDSFPVLASPGIVDHRPLTEPVHDDWRRYYANRSD